MFLYRCSPHIGCEGSVLWILYFPTKYDLDICHPNLLSAELLMQAMGCSRLFKLENAEASLVKNVQVLKVDMIYLFS